MVIGHIHSIYVIFVKKITNIVGCQEQNGHIFSDYFRSPRMKLRQNGTVSLSIKLGAPPASGRADI
jgi:hypothetical protein